MAQNINPQLILCLYDFLFQILGTDYKKGLLNWIDEENIPKYLGGLSEGSLLDDLGPWSDTVLCNRIGVDIEELTAGKRLQPVLHFGTMQVCFS